MSWALDRTVKRRRSSWVGNAGVYEAFDDLQGQRATARNEILRHGKLTTSDVALFDDGESGPINRRHDYTHDELAERLKAAKARKVAVQQRRWEQSRRDRQVRKERQADQEWRVAELLKAERAKGLQAHYTKHKAEQLREAALAAQLEAERAELETAQWVEDRNDELRQRQLARAALGYGGGRILSIDELIEIGEEMVRVASGKHLKR